jgi:hypothetical protein
MRPSPRLHTSPGGATVWQMNAVDAGASKDNDLVEQHKRPGDMADQSCPSRQAEYFWFFDRYLIGVVSR